MNTLVKLSFVWIAGFLALIPGRLYGVVDAGVVSIFSPSDSACVGEETPVEITIQNFGNDTLFLVPVGLEVSQNGTLIIRDTIETFIPPGSGSTVVLNKTLDLREGGRFSFVVYTMLSQDVDRSNDTLFANFTLLTSPVFNLGNDTTLSPRSVLIINAGLEFEAYRWSTGANSSAIAVGTGGVYSVTVTAENKCTAVDSISVKTVTNVGENSLGQLKIYPNPATDYLVIDFDQLPAEKTRLTLIDMNGKQVMNKKINLIIKDENILSLTELQKGFYVVVIEVKDEIYSHKILIK